MLTVPTNDTIRLDLLERAVCETAIVRDTPMFHVCTVKPA